MRKESKKIRKTKMRRLNPPVEMSGLLLELKGRSEKMSAFKKKGGRRKKQAKTIPTQKHSPPRHQPF
jgi:hypothetical protein